MLLNRVTVKLRKCERTMIAEALHLAHIAMIILGLALLLIEERWVVGRVPA